MAAVALLTFTQGALSADGEALVVLPNVPVNIGNSDPTDVLSWRIELLEGPAGSAFQQTPGSPTIIAEDDGSVVAASFTPGATPGCYRFRLTVWEASFSGPSNVDIRNIAVLTPRLNALKPPYQLIPSQLPLSNDPDNAGDPTAKPDELNFDGQPYGWAGDEAAARRLLNAFVQVVDDQADPPTPEPLVFLADGQAEIRQPLIVDTDGTDLWFGNAALDSGSSPFDARGLLNSYVRTRGLPSDNVTEFGTDFPGAASTRAVVYDAANDRMIAVLYDQPDSECYVRTISRDVPAVVSEPINVTGPGFGEQNIDPRNAVVGGGYLWIVTSQYLLKCPLDDLGAVDFVSGIFTGNVWLAFDEGAGNRYGDGEGRIYVKTLNDTIARFIPSNDAFDVAFTPEPGESVRGLAIDQTSGRMWAVWEIGNTSVCGSFDLETFGANIRSVSVESVFSSVGFVWDLFAEDGSDQCFVLGEFGGVSWAQCSDNGAAISLDQSYQFPTGFPNTGDQVQLNIFAQLRKLCGLNNRIYFPCSFQDNQRWALIGADYGNISVPFVVDLGTRKRYVQPPPALFVATYDRVPGVFNEKILFDEAFEEVVGEPSNDNFTLGYYSVAAAMNTMVWEFDTNTTVSDPGNGDFKFNGGWGSATILMLDQTKFGAGTIINMDAILEQWKVGDRIHIRKVKAATINDLATIEITGAPINNGGWWQMDISWLWVTGTGPSFGEFFHFERHPA